MRGNVPIGPKADSDWLYVVPDGIRSLLRWVNKRYDGPEIVITENGVDVPNESNMTLETALNDTFRIQFYSGYLTEVSKAIIEDRIPITGYFAWSLMDNFEWADGYSKRFGLHYVDYKKNQTRHKKQSSKFYSEIIDHNKKLLWPWLFVFIISGVLIFVIVISCHYYKGKQVGGFYEPVND